MLEHLLKALASACANVLDTFGGDPLGQTDPYSAAVSTPRFSLAAVYLHIQNQTTAGVLIAYVMTVRVLHGVPGSACW